MPQYGKGDAVTMVEVLRSKIYYASAFRMIVLPKFMPLSDLPGGEVILPLLRSVLRLLDRRSKDGSAAAHMAHQAVSTVIASNLVAEPGYFSRVWTLAGEWFA